MVVFLQKICIWAKVVVFGQIIVFLQPWFLSGKNCCIRAKVVLLGQSGCIREKLVVF